MVQVPIAPGRSVQVQEQPRDRFRYTEARNLVGPAVERFGQEVQRAADTLNSNEEAYAQAEYIDAQNRYSLAVAAAKQEFGQLKGGAPANSLQDYSEALRTEREKILSEMKYERARNGLANNLASRYDGALIDLKNHADAEMLQFRTSGLEASIGLEAKDAVAAYGTEQFDVHLETALMRERELADLRGDPAETLAAAQFAREAAIRYDTVVALATQGEPTAALAQAEAWEDRFAPEQFSRLNQLLRPRAEAKAARDLVPGILDEAAAGLPKQGGGEGGRPAPVGNARAIGQQVYPGLNITSHRRKAGAAGKAGANSWHVKSAAAIDAAPIQGMSFQQYVQGYRDAGYTIIEAVDETDPATMRRTGATGPHWHVVLGEKGSGGGQSAALDPRLDPEFAEAAARKYAEANNLSESQTDALVDAARDRSGALLRQRNLREQEEERQFDQAIVDKNIDFDNVTDEGQLPADAWDGLSPSSQAQKRQQFARNRERIQREREAEVQAAQMQNAILAGGAVDYADSGTKKAADALYAQQLSARGRMDTHQLMKFNVDFATRIGFVPPSLRGQIRGQLRSADPSLQVAAAATIAEISARNPAILGDFSQEEIARAEQLNEYRRRGVPIKDAVERMSEMERISKADRDDRGSQFTDLAKKAGGADDALDDAFGVPPSPALVGEFNGLWKQEFIRTGDIDLARSTALAAMRRTWGVSYVNGSARAMKNPPELHYGRLDKGEDDAEWIRDQAFKELYGSGVSNPGAKDRFQLRLWNRTINGQPVYIGTLTQPDGTIVTAVDERGRPKLYRPDFNSSAAAKRIQRDRAQNIQNARDRRRGRPPRRTPNNNPGWKL